MLAITLGIFIIVPPFVSIYNTCKRLAAAERLTGTPPGMEPGLLFILWVFLSPVAEYIFQSNMNKVLQNQAGGAGQMAGAPAAPPPQAAAPVEQPAPPPAGAAAGVASDRGTSLGQPRLTQTVLFSR